MGRRRHRPIGVAIVAALVLASAAPAMAARHSITRNRAPRHARWEVGLPVVAGQSGRPDFDPSSFWNQQVGAAAPTDPSSAAIISFIKADNLNNFVTLSGTASDGKWGTPQYSAKDGDPTYAVVNSCSSRQPPEFAAIRIPVGARPDPTPDASMVVVDSGKGLEYGLWHASFDRTTDRWSACGGTVYYLASNGLAGTLKQSNEKRNYGHRGVPPSVYAITYDEIAAGSINHLLKLAVDTTRCTHVFPMTGDECGTSNATAPPEGAIIRIKASINLDALGLSPAALIVARALQTYGAIISDQSGRSVELKVENGVAEGRGWLWNGVLSATSLSRIPLDSYEVVKLGYGG
jgi:hypothetical protein